MRTCVLVLFAVLIGLLEPAFGGTLTVSSGLKSADLRFAGGGVSNNAVSITNGQYVTDDGFYSQVQMWLSRKETDNELHFGGGFVKPCFWVLTCKAEAMVWVLPKFDRSIGDLVDIAGEVSGKKNFGNLGTFGGSFRFEKQLVIGKSDNELYRANMTYEHPVFGVPARLLVEYDYNAQKRWSHLPISVSTTLTPSWLPEKYSITPSIDVLIPLNDQTKRKVGYAGGFVFNYKL